MLTAVERQNLASLVAYSKKAESVLDAVEGDKPNTWSRVTRRKEVGSRQ